MLNEADESLIERDSAIPGLRLLLDDALLRDALSDSIPQPGFVGAQAEYLRYKPGVSCLARLRLQTATETSFAYAVAYHRNAYDKLAKAAEFCDENGRSPILVHANSMVVYPFPLDRRLPALARFATQESIHELLERAAPQLLPDRTAGQKIELATLRYKPERRYVAKLAAAGRPFAALKMYSTDSYERAKRAAKIIGVDGGISHALWAGHSDRHAAIIFNWVDGDPLPDQLTDQNTADVRVRNAARSLRTLHRLVRTKLPKGLLSAALRRAHESVRVLMWIDEPSAALVQEMSEQVGNYLCELESSPAVPIHGDLHLKQFLVGHDAVRLIDFDRSRLGDPAEDLGNLYADLIRRSIITPADADFRSLFDCFSGEYRHAGGDIDLRRVHLYATIRLLELATEPFRTRQPNWLAQTRPFIAAASRVCDKIVGGVHVSNSRPKPPQTHRATVDDPSDVVSDDALPNAAEAIDPRLAQLRLREAASIVDEPVDIAMDSIRVLRHKLGRRCLIEYRGRLKTDDSPIRIFGKVHAAARHSKCLALQHALWNAGFDDNCPDGICVARPLGAIHEWHMWLQLGVPGQTAWHVLESPRAADFARRIAEAAHKLHRAKVPPSRVHTLDDELALLASEFPRLAEELPDLRQPLADLLETCRERSRSIDEVAPVGIHHDFYPDQVLVNGDRLYVVDHDWYATGDPRVDIGNFVGHLIERSLRVTGHPHFYDLAAEAMIDRFIELNSAPEQWRAAIAEYTMLTLARHVYLSRRFPDRRDTTRQLIDLLCDGVAVDS
jgi:aminoglycoside phosphotransferase (APT) family kinase protein